jgi:hypothetical protein
MTDRLMSIAPQDLELSEFACAAEEGSLHHLRLAE